jgi:putative ABC transport system ATP-binding protein
LYELRSVTKRFQNGRAAVTALEDVDLDIPRGEFVVIQGPTGHGKTTLLQMLGALDRPTSGSILFEGDDLARMREDALAGLRSRAFGFVFQTFNLIPTLSAQENVETALVPLKVSSEERRTKAAAALGEVGLSTRARHLPSELSGGEQQRVAIARALVRRPEVILADEPTGNLDEVMREEIMDLLSALWEAREQTLVVVTHDSAVAARGSRRIWIREGRIADGPSHSAPRVKSA